MSDSTPFDWRKYLPVHPAADEYPLLRESDPVAFRALVEDIRAHGVHTQLIFWSDGKGNRLLLDGRNRLDVNAELGVLGVRRKDPEDEDDEDQLVFVKEFDGASWVPLPEYAHQNVVDWSEKVQGDPYTLAASLNAHRRHLEPEQYRARIEASHARIKAALGRDPDKSDRAHGEELGVDHKTVGGVRRKMEDVGSLPHVETRKDTKGRKQPAKKQRKTIEERDRAECIALNQKVLAAEQELVEHKAAAGDPEASTEERKAKLAALDEEVTDVLDSDEEAAKYLEALGVDRFFRVLQYAPRLKAAIEPKPGDEDGGTFFNTYSALIELEATLDLVEIEALAAFVRRSRNDDVERRIRRALRFAAELAAKLDEEPPSSPGGGSEPKVEETAETVPEQTSEVPAQVGTVSAVEDSAESGLEPLGHFLNEHRAPAAEHERLAEQRRACRTAGLIPDDLSIPPFMRRTAEGSDAPVPLTPPPKPTTPPAPPPAPSQKPQLVWEDHGATPTGQHAYSTQTATGKYWINPSHAFPSMNFVGYSVVYRWPDPDGKWTLTVDGKKVRAAERTIAEAHTIEKAKAAAQKHYDHGSPRPVPITPPAPAPVPPPPGPPQAPQPKLRTLATYQPGTEDDPRWNQLSADELDARIRSAKSYAGRSRNPRRVYAHVEDMQKRLDVLRAADRAAKCIVAAGSVVVH